MLSPVNIEINFQKSNENLNNSRAYYTVAILRSNFQASKTSIEPSVDK